MLMVENFGPIRASEIELRPLTLLIGPNATGKSYLLYLLWSLYRVEPSWEVIVDKAKEVFEGVKRLVGTGEFRGIASLISGFYAWFLENLGLLIGENLKDLLKDTSMVGDVGELVRRAKVVVGRGDEAAVRVFEETVEHLEHFRR